MQSCARKETTVVKEGNGEKLQWMNVPMVEGSWYTAQPGHCIKS
jgi:hypothetical protein